LGGPRFRWFRHRFVAQLFFGPDPVLNVLSVFAAALNIQLMSLESDLFSRWFSVFDHGNSLIVLAKGAIEITIATSDNLKSPWTQKYSK
jgi:hypothetical protein